MTQGATKNHHHTATKPSAIRWTVMAAYAAALTTSTMTFLTYATVTSGVRVDFGVSEASVGNLALLSPLFLVLLGAVSGRFLDRRFDTTLAVGAAMIAVGPLLRLVDPSSYGWALAGQVLITAGTPFVANAITKYPARYFSAQERPTVIALLSAAFYLGVLLAAVTGQPLYECGGITLLVGVHAAVGTAAGVALLIMVTVVRVPVAVVDPEPAVARGHLRRTRELWMLAGVMFVLFGLFNAFITWIETVQDHLGNAGFGGPLVIALTLGGVTGAITIPGLAARRDARRTALIVISVVQVFGFLAFAATGNQVILLVLAVVVGFFMMAALPIAFEWSEIHAGIANAASATAFLTIVGNLGGVVFVLAPQMFLDTPRVIFVLLAALSIPGVLAALRLPPTPTPHLIAA
ncbi:MULTISPECIES: MFS transporter [unclassified Rhodococcus (in: high G+C Gram-positive bacteria)]|uniref:MFS transporter n=1 Tax=unclassified Rhodococcus (in: high G+C Gram-positive bacteria) TaxID=192944 RepID=UPI00163B2C26|nr:MULTISPECIES: MFS transporter [unclassified Rhodococcus (in: high G+C Gram-positive bacteria)]MBC2641985.1 MFS transporter [Rhodococcus sp. 3A]MBC2893274.1 MFS transporter [Rhodococcus sp. 4CII]